MARMGVYDQIKSAFQDIVAPEIHALRGEIARLDGRITALDAKVEGLDAKMVAMKAELLAEIRRVDTRVDAVHTRIDSVHIQIDSVNTRLDSLERSMHMAIDVRERLAALETATFLILVDTGPLVALCEPGDRLNRTALRDPDWADAYLAVVTGTDQRFRLWTYDREFRTTWRRPNGTPIPLVPSR